MYQEIKAIPPDFDFPARLTQTTHSGQSITLKQAYELIKSETGGFIDFTDQHERAAENLVSLLKIRGAIPKTREDYHQMYVAYKTMHELTKDAKYQTLLRAAKTMMELSKPASI
jgi:hypothetical protein